MKQSTLQSLETHLATIFDRNKQPTRWPPEGFVVVEASLDDPGQDPFDEYQEENAFTAAQQTLLRPDDAEALAQRLHETQDSLTRILGRDPFPGAPNGLKDKGFMPPTDAYAFYLPWHEFTANHWGIYLLYDGITTLGTEIEKVARGALSSVDARYVAKIFLFHHEAYHNAVETFAGRLEVSHRERCYIGGMRRLHHNVTRLPQIHEEALANAYAIVKVKQHAFPAVQPPRRRRTIRDAAVRALCAVTDQQRPPYNDGSAVFRNLDSWERIFQERAHQACFSPRLPERADTVWDAFPHALHPSLRRNGAYTYFIPRSHPIIRERGEVFYFDRRKFLQRLKQERPGKLVPGGRHQKWRTVEGQMVPIPSGDIAIGTARSILKDLDLLASYGSVDRFLAGS
jgi:hypothetical protein